MGVVERARGRARPRRTVHPIMKYGAIPTTLFERLALWTGKVPVPIIDALFGPLKARAIMAGVSLGVFTAIGHGEYAAADLAQTLRLDPDALELLLRTLVVCDYVVQRGDRFALTAMARQTMVEGGAMQLSGYLRFNYVQWEFIGHLEELVRTGHGLNFHDTMTASDRWHDYQLGMLELARIDAPIVAARVPVRKGASSLLDLAGSHGLFGAAICRKHPPLRSTVIDLPPAVAHARPLAEAAGIADVVTHREGDLQTADLGTDHDVVLLANILHHFAAQRIVAILRRAHDAMRPQGTMAIWEAEAPKQGTRASEGDAVALYFRLTSTAGAYHADQYSAWLRDAGFAGIKVVRPALSPGNVLITGRASGRQGGATDGEPGAPT
jgi:2-polyprenyl-3-methyl-5-hydroxy-6-metoxy-1,4-benzoquinol methylase